MLVVSIPQYVQGLTNAKVDLDSADLTTLYTAPTTADFNAVSYTHLTLPTKQDV